MNTSARRELDEAWYVQSSHKHYAWLKEMIASRLPPAYQHYALDLCQEVFVDFWIRRDEVPVNPRAWLFARARKKLSRFERDRRLEAGHTFALTDEMRERLSDFLHGADLNVDFARAFAMLRKTEAEMLWMRMLGLAAHEIAEHYGLNEDAARQRIKRALDKLRSRFDPTDSGRSPSGRHEGNG